MSQGVRLMGLWAKQAQNGETYHEGSLGGGTVRIFTNNYKRTDKDPDIVMYLSPKPKPQANAGAPQASRPKITPRPQTQAQPQRPQTTPQQREEFAREYRDKAVVKQEYVDHTKGGYGVDPQDPNVPWPDGEDMPF